MRVFLHGDSNGRPPARFHKMMLCPAAHVVGEEVPADWVDAKNNPKQFEVDFVHGEAEVDDRLGKYMVKYGMASKTRLILPAHFSAA